MTSLIKKTIQTIALLLALLVFAAIALATETRAQTVSLTFDDGFLSTYEKALPILSGKNYKGTVYVTPGFINRGYIDSGLPAMTWQQVVKLQNVYGWEIGGHSYTHAELPNLTTEQIINELVRSTDELKSYGLAISNFASPYGAYDNRVLTETLKLYDSHRGYWDRQALNSYPYQKDVLMVKAVESSTRVATVKSWIDNAVANRKWLILVFHDVQPRLNQSYGYVTKTSDLTSIVNYLSQKNVSVKTISEALKKPGVRMLGNTDFAGGLTGWYTDTPSQVVTDNSNNGAYPNPQNSVKMTGGSANAHLYSQNIAVTQAGSYFVEAFFNTTNLTNGEFGFYVDEYDSQENWISGKWLGSVSRNDVGYFSGAYTKTSDSVNQVRLQLYLTGGSAGYVYTDNIDFHDNNGTGSTPSPLPSPTLTPTATPFPSVTPTVTPSVAPTTTPTVAPTATPTVTPVPALNLVANGSFENTDSSNWALNWVKQTIDWAVVTLFADNGTKSVKVGGVSRTHLFSDLIPVQSGKAYTWKQYVKAEKVGSEFGFYIDEYDSQGNWISGQWKDGIWSPFSGFKTYGYTPTNSNVAKIGLQYYLAGGGSDSLIYLDSVSLTSN